MTGSNVTQGAKGSARCPICRKPTAPATRPFCSQRCRDIDLARWLGGTYAIPGGSADADEDGDSTTEPPDNTET